MQSKRVSLLNEPQLGISSLVGLLFGNESEPIKFRCGSTAGKCQLRSSVNDWYVEANQVDPEGYKRFLFMRLVLSKHISRWHSAAAVASSLAGQLCCSAR